VSGDDRLKRFEQTVLPHLDAAYNLARWLARNDQDAEDIVQDACLRAFRFFDGFHGDDAKPWLLAILRNRYYDWQARRRDHLPLALFDGADEADGSGEAPSPADPDSPESLLLGHERRAILNRAIAALPPEFREVIVLRELEDLSYKEIAAIIGTPVGTVMSRLARARKQLARQFRPASPTELDHGL
jgi:RNA polymerase sigma-70 factor (ECF subfamily)